ncbi:MAG: dihydrodipicolinate synthase family protein [Clostridia bacterium]|nr:dihydrodipicolinate synthase family protein [Clostridia bacterium]
MNHVAKGVYPTMITPYDEAGQVDMDAVRRIVEWYVAHGVDGIFAVCQSSEMFFLTEDERAALAAEVVKAAAGRVCVVASGHVSDAIDDQIRELRRVQDAGAAALVLVSNRLAGPEEDDGVLLANMNRILEALPEATFGMYECPYPYKRLLSQRVLEAMAETGRFAFIKDTCCDAVLIARRVKLLDGRVGLFNANSATLLDTLRSGADGFSGIMANFHPELYAWLYRNYQVRPEEAEALSAFLSLASGIERGLYPTSAKYHMNRVGVPMTLRCRNQKEESFTPLLRREIDDLILLERRFLAEYV